MGSTTKGKLRKQPKRNNPPAAEPSSALAVPPAERLGAMLEEASKGLVIGGEQLAASVTAFQEQIQRAGESIVFRRDSLGPPLIETVNVHDIFGRDLTRRRWNGHPVTRPLPGDTLLSEHDAGVASVVTATIARALHISEQQIRYNHLAGQDAYEVIVRRSERDARVAVAHTMFDDCVTVREAERLGKQFAYQLERALQDKSPVNASTRFSEPEPEPQVLPDPWESAVGCAPITDVRQIVGEWISARPGSDGTDEVRVELKSDIAGLIKATAVPELDRARPLPAWTSALSGWLILDNGLLRVSSVTAGVQLGRGLLYFESWTDGAPLILSRPGIAELLVPRAWLQIAAGDIVPPVLSAEAERPRPRQPEFYYGTQGTITLSDGTRIDPSYFEP